MANMIDNRVPRIGDVYLMKFDGTGHEQSGWRPGVVFQNNIGNYRSPNIIALPMTTALKKRMQPTHVMVKAHDTGILKDSIVLCENPERISKDRMGNYITSLSEDYMVKIARGNLIATSAIGFMNIEDVIAVWEQSIRINAKEVPAVYRVDDNGGTYVQ